MKYTKTTKIEIEISDEFIQEYREDHDDCEITMEDIKNYFDECSEEELFYMAHEEGLIKIKENSKSKIQ